MHLVQKQAVSFTEVNPRFKHRWPIVTTDFARLYFLSVAKVRKAYGRALLQN